MSRMDINDIQGNILKAYRMPLARYRLVRFHDVEGARRFVGRLLPRVTTARPWPKDSQGKPHKPETTWNIGFTHPGLAALGLRPRSLASFPLEFQQGMRARAAILGDDGESAPEHWDSEWCQARVHAWVSINARQLEPLAAEVQRLDEAVGDSRAVETVATQPAAMLGGHREHFGYTDGISNPDIAGSGLKRETRRGKLAAGGGWVPLAAGEFLLGHPDEALELPAAPLPNLLARNGTYMVYRKLHQKVALFRSFLKEQGEKYGDVELFAARLVGRWRDGTPLALSPDRPDNTLIANNDFDYTDDPDGLRCPLGAHVRRVNPRNTQGFNGVLANRHRIIRRGLPYGDALPEGVLEDDGKNRGIIFMALNASIERQFEFIQSEWINYGNDFRLGNDRDPIVGSHDGRSKVVIPGRRDGQQLRPPFICAGLERFVVTRGGDYFFIPSITALHQIAAGCVEDK